MSAVIFVTVNNNNKLVIHVRNNSVVVVVFNESFSICVFVSVTFNDSTAMSPFCRMGERSDRYITLRDSDIRTAAD